MYVTPFELHYFYTLACKDHSKYFSTVFVNVLLAPFIATAGASGTFPLSSVNTMFLVD